MNITRRCHYLPQFYLSNFVNSDKNFYVYYKEDEEDPKVQTPLNTGIERDLYNAINEDGIISDSVEKELLAPVEGAVGPIINQLLSSKSINDSDISDLALFSAFMATRVPKTIDHSQKLMETIQTFQLKELAEKPEEIDRFLKYAKENGKDYDGITVEKMIDEIKHFEDRYRIEANKKVATGMSLLTTLEVYKLLLEMNWCLCRAPSNSVFITSDCPVVCKAEVKKGSFIFGGGFGLPNAEITFPISPERCLYIHRRNAQKYRAISESFLKEINKRTAWTAEKFLISNKNNLYIKKLKNWARESLNSPKIDEESLLHHYKKNFKYST